MFVSWRDPAVCLTGRWTHAGYPAAPGEPRGQDVALTTAPGSWLRLGFAGRTAHLVFDLGCGVQPQPHLWLCVDGGAQVEVPLDRHLRVTAPSDGPHELQVIYKGGAEILPRWRPPLMGAVAFAGAYVEQAVPLAPDDRMLVEFIGDSITEGVLVDADFSAKPCHLIQQFDRPYQDDSWATYAALTAQRLNLRPMFQAYGAVGVITQGCGGVPDAAAIYPYAVEGVPYTGPAPRVVVVNHGTNDSRYPPETFRQAYARLLAVIRRVHPRAMIVCLTPLCGVFPAEVAACVAERQAAGDRRICCISTQGWLPPEPIHPLRDGHRLVADHLTPLLGAIIHALTKEETA